MHPNTILFSYSHSIDEVQKTLEVMDKSLSNLSEAIKENSVLKKLKGNVAKSVISQIKD